MIAIPGTGGALTVTTNESSTYAPAVSVARSVIVAEPFWFSANASVKLPPSSVAVTRAAFVLPVTERVSVSPLLAMSTSPKTPDTSSVCAGASSSTVTSASGLTKVGVSFTAMTVTPTDADAVPPWPSLIV